MQFDRPDAVAKKRDGTFAASRRVLAGMEKTFNGRKQKITVAQRRAGRTTLLQRPVRRVSGQVKDEADDFKAREDCAARLGPWLWQALPPRRPQDKVSATKPDSR